MSNRIHSRAGFALPGPLDAHLPVSGQFGPFDTLSP